MLYNNNAYIQLLGVIEKKKKMDFEILIDETFLNLNTKDGLTLINNKNILSIINDFEDKEWRNDKFQNFIWDNISETALSFRERQSLINQPLSQLREAAKKLRLTDKIKDISKGSELAEILLYGIMKQHYKALPVVPKIYYKQNPSDNAKGADSVHIVIDEKNKDFTIWFGEAKFYNNIENSRLGEIVKSVENSLITHKIKKENSIITDLSDLDLLIKDKEFSEKIKTALFTTQSIDKLKPKLHVPILILHECSITKNSTTDSDSYKKEIINFHKDRAQNYYEKQIKKFGHTLHLYSDITFHIILFPVPEKKTIVNEFLSIASFHKK